MATVSLLPVLFGVGLLASPAIAQKPYLRPSGMPENALVAFDQYEKPTEAALGHELLATYSFRWMVQVPREAGVATLRLSLVTEKGEEIKELAKLSWHLVPIDPAKRKDRPTFFPVELHLMPDTPVSSDPWRESKRVLAFLKSPDLEFRLREPFTNPFRRNREGIGIMHTSRLAVPVKLAHGGWDGFGTAFDIMEDNQTRERLRVTFDCSGYLGER